MGLFYKELDNEALAKMSFDDLRTHAQRAIRHSRELSDFHYADNVLQHCIARLAFNPQRRQRPNGQGGGDGNQKQNHGDRRR
jgi:hypothetical protein